MRILATPLRIAAFHELKAGLWQAARMYFPFTAEFLFAIGVAAVAFLIGMWYLHRRAKRTRSVGRRVEGGPSNLRFTCAGCSVKFTHSRRTLSAWQQGTRKFYCKACHTKAQGTGVKHGR